MKLEGLPDGYLDIATVEAWLGRDRRNLLTAGVIGPIGLLDHYQVGQTNLYLTDQVTRFKAWLIVREAYIQDGSWPRNSPLLPPARSIMGQWQYIDTAIETHIQSIKEYTNE